jgi:hypothetical protein
MPDDLLQVLTRFHREVVLPDIERVVDSRFMKVDQLRDEMLTHFDAIYHRLDRLETEYQMAHNGATQRRYIPSAILLAINA